MNAPLDIGRLSTRIRSGEPERAQALAGHVRCLADRQLARALDGAGERALARAGLPAGAMVAVRRLDLALKVSADVAPPQLAEGWAAAFEAALARLLAGTPPGDEGPDAVVVWFADAWAAEGRHLQRRAAGQPDAWWAQGLAADNHRPDAGDTSPDGLDALTILLRWLARDPPRAVAAITALAGADARIATLLDPDAARTLTRRLLALFAHGATAALPPASGLAAGTRPQRPQPPLTDASRLLALALERLGSLPTTILAALGTSSGAPGAQALAAAAPWLLAALFARQPALTRLSSNEIEHALMHWLQRRTAPPPPARAPADALTNPPAQAEATPEPPAAGPDSIAAHHETHAGGLLLLLRPLVRLELLPAPEQLAQGLGDLALTALRRVLAPLPPTERAVAQEREHPLLAVFAPECDWRERIATLPVRNPAAAEALLDALVDAIPADIAFAPGAPRCIFGRTPPAFATAPAQRLACLLLRPGVLTVSAWEAELTWPLASIDLALRRAGWDQDPGWLPWLGRSLRLRFGDMA